MTRHNGVPMLGTVDIQHVDLDCNHLFRPRIRQRRCQVCAAHGHDRPRSFTTADCRLDLCHDHMHDVIEGRLREVDAARLITIFEANQYLEREA